MIFPYFINTSADSVCLDDIIRLIYTVKIFQTFSVELPARYMVRGAVMTKSKLEIEMNTWQWSMARPTKLRMYDKYSEVFCSE